MATFHFLSKSESYVQHLIRFFFFSPGVDDVSFYAMVPVGLYLGVVQYKGRISVGVCSDGLLEPEPKRLVEGWEEALRSLKVAAGCP